MQRAMVRIWKLALTRKGDAACSLALLIISSGTMLQIFCAVTGIALKLKWISVVPRKAIAVRTNAQKGSSLNMVQMTFLVRIGSAWMLIVILAVTPWPSAKITFRQQDILSKRQLQ